jgi:tRNA (uracil-5-)-methyltransferase TRM9
LDQTGKRDTELHTGVGLTRYRSQALVNIAKKHEPHDVVVADNLSLPHPNSSFDFAISIAVIHHLSSPSRRVQAVEEILQLLRRPPPDGPTDTCNIGRALIYVWALEQENSRRGWGAGDEQDVMVPWVTKEKSENGQGEETKTFNRFYHLYRSEELESDIKKAKGHVITSGYEKDNWWAIVTKGS